MKVSDAQRLKEGQKPLTVDVVAIETAGAGRP
jgi:hypothetical protein